MLHADDGNYCKKKIWTVGGNACFNIDGTKMCSLELLKGGVLGLEQKLLGYGFKWENPNADGDCGCHLLRRWIAHACHGAV